jgi:hypothetical protein
MDEAKPFNQEAHPSWNAEPGIARVPGSNFLKETAKFEQFHSAWTAGTNGPGNPYVKREYPKMLYRAQHFNGKVACMAAPPDPYNFKDHREAERAEEAARRFTEQCQRIVGNETERSRAMEDGWREGPAEAVEYLLARDRAVSTADAHRAYEDRNMSEGAKREIAEASAEVGGEHLPEIPRKRVGRPRKNAPAA